MEKTLMALAIAQENQTRSDGEVGGGMQLHKTNGKSAYGPLAAEFLEMNGGTFHWDKEADGGLFGNIYQRIAADMFAPNGDLGARYEAGRDNEKIARSAFSHLADWLDGNYGQPLYRLTAPGTGNGVAIITIDGDYVVDDVRGLTARQSQFNRDKRALQGMVGATYKRQARAVGQIEAKKILLEAFDDLSAIQLPAPKRA